MHVGRPSLESLTVVKYQNSKVCQAIFFQVTIMLLVQSISKGHSLSQKKLSYTVTVVVIFIRNMCGQVEHIEQMKTTVIQVMNIDSLKL